MIPIDITKTDLDRLITEQAAYMSMQFLVMTLSLNPQPQALFQTVATLMGAIASTEAMRRNISYQKMEELLLAQSRTTHAHVSQIHANMGI